MTKPGRAAPREEWDVIDHSRLENVWVLQPHQPHSLEGALLDLAIVGVASTIGESARIGTQRGARPTGAISPEYVVLIGARADVASGARLKRGARVDPRG